MRVDRYIRVALDIEPDGKHSRQPATNGRMMKIIAGCLLLLSLNMPSISHAAVTTENFDANWDPMPQTTYTNGTNFASGWISWNIRIYDGQGFESPSNAAVARPSTGGWTESPSLSNGAGVVSFYVKGPSTGSGTGVVEICTDEVNWRTNGTLHAVSGTSWQLQTNVINTNVITKVRIRRIAGTWYWDSISISGPPPAITISNLTASPSSPADLDPVWISANVSIAGINDELYATNFWREWPNTSWNAIAMTNNGAGRFFASNTVPGKAIGAVVEYYVSATCVSDGTPYTTNTPVQSFVVRPQSGYTNLSVTGDINTNLWIGQNYAWQRAVALSNAVNNQFRYQGVSNGITTLWGDSNQTATNMPAYGTAEANATNILLSRTNTGTFVWNFNDVTRGYSVIPCDYLNFDSWTSTTFNSYGNYTNGSWIVYGGATSNDSARILSGRSLMLNGQQGGASSTYLLSPPLSNGIGQISFWYRSWATNASPSARLDIQVATSPTSATWITVATVTNIISTNYLYYTVGRSDRENQYVRFLNNANSTSSRLCLDEVIIAQPGAGVVPSGITNTPLNPSIIDTVDISGTLTPMSDALVTNVVLWYRMGSDGNFDQVSMSTTNGLFWKNDTPIPRAGTGIVQYVIQCFYSGFQSESSSPQWIPSAGTNNPAYYTVADASSERSENFDANWFPMPQSTYTNGTNTATGWNSWNVRLYDGQTYESPSNAAVARPSTGGWTQSPVLSNGVGTLSFYVKGPAVGSGTGVVEVSSDDINWSTSGSPHAVSGSSWQYQTNSIYTNAHIKVRLRRVAGTWYWDSIQAPYPPADVLITNVYTHPAYPSEADDVTVTCDLFSVNPLFEAWALTPTLYYRRQGTTSFTAIPMTRVSGTLYSTSPYSVPAFRRDTVIEYYIRCDFKGYYGSDLDNHSPRLFPAEGSAGPSTYTVRQFASSYSNVAAIVNGTLSEGRLLENGIWQKIVTIPDDTNILTFAFSGFGYGAGSGYSTNAVVWGNASNWQSGLPLSDYSATGQTEFAISGLFPKGQEILLRFDEYSGLYLVTPCVFQDFNSVANSSLYILKLIGSSTSAPPSTLSFTSVPTNTARIRRETFDNIRWGDYTGGYVEGGIGGDDFFVLYGAKINTSVGSAVEPDPARTRGTRWVAQIVDEGNPAFRGLEYVIYSYRAINTSSNIPKLGVYFFPTNAPYSSDYYELTQTNKWLTLTNNISVTNMSFVSVTNVLQTNFANNIIWSQDQGTNQIAIDTIELKEWYSQSITNAGWTVTHAWIENGPVGRVCRLEPRRASPPVNTNQYIVSPLLTNGIYTCSIDFSAGANGSASFDLDVAYETPDSWTNVAQVVTNVTNPGSNYINTLFTFLIPPTNAYMRLVNKTAAPGSLLIKQITVEPNVQGETWKMNNIAIDELDPVRRYELRSGFLNSNRTSNIGAPTPNTNIFAYVRTPPLQNGIGEISFWYRNWAIRNPVPPAKIVVQTCLTDSTNILDWTTVATITNVVNTNDYLYFRTSVYDTNSQYVRIYNDDLTVTGPGRICIDDILITAPLASRLSMSNLVCSPVIPLYSNSVDILVDVYHLFLTPSNLNFLALYGTATNYDGLATAPLTSITMSCIASNLSTPGKWYRFKTSTPIPTNSIDTFVRYSVRATYEGEHTEITSPQTNSQFGVYPYWYDPMNTVYGTNQAYYVVYSCPTGAVWFNEINYVDDSYDLGSWTNEYVEVCGPSGISLKDWSVQILSDYASGGTVSVYRITNNFVLPADTNGHGFWVLGDAVVRNVDTPFTHLYTNYMDSLSTNQQLPIAGGFVLLRKTGAYEDRVTYGQLVDEWAGFVHAGDCDTYYGQLAMYGAGASRADFEWASEVMHYSPGTVNTNQAITGENTAQNATPTIIIFAFRIDTNVWINCSTTNNWFPVPWYSTNLLLTNAWTNVPVFARSIATTNCTINFARPTNSTPHFYKVVATNSP